MTVLMVSPYPPTRDGIAAYAVQEVAALRAAGTDVEVLSPYPSAAHHHLDLCGPRGALALAKRVSRYERVIVQFHPEIFYPLPKTNGSWAIESLALRIAFARARRLEVRIHEIDYRDGRDHGLLGFASRRLWRAADQVVVHTERERTDFISAFRVDPKRVLLSPHGAHFQRRTSMNREQARASLAIPAKDMVFLAIGFIQPHKGFDRAIRAFAGLGRPNTRLDIVGSARLEDRSVATYVAELRTLASTTPGTHLHFDYVSDEMFDRWLVAADVVVLPYRSIWSSGVLERAALYDRPVIATTVGGLPEQAAAHPGVTLVADDAELARAMWLATGAAAGGPLDPWPVESSDLRTAVQAMVIDRAAARRGGKLPAATVIAPGGAVPTSPSAPLRRLPTFRPPQPSSARFLPGLAKRVVRRLIAWEYEPLAEQVNALQAATVLALDGAAGDEYPPTAQEAGDLRR